MLLLYMDINSFVATYKICCGKANVGCIRVYVHKFLKGSLYER